MKNLIFLPLCLILAACGNSSGTTAKNDDSTTGGNADQTKVDNKPGIDTARYDSLSKYLVNGDTSGRWPVRAPYPLPGAILPFNRVIAYYGNLYSTRMGALGEFPKKEMFAKLQAEVKRWSEADTVIKSIPALHYIAVTAQGAPGKGGKYRLRMPFHQIDTIINWAKEINALVFIDIQVGLSTIQEELPELEKYMAMPQVHLGMDPEFALANSGYTPGQKVGIYDAKDVNYVIDYLSDIVRKNNLPPKILVVHRFTQGMVKNSDQIKPTPEVQVVMHMDGWGNPAKKRSTYYSWIAPQPVQFTGFKLFYKNDTERVGEKATMQPQDLLKLSPVPVYIQYQ
jgi:hypothetical protein